MKLEIYDKAKWHISNDETKESITNKLRHFHVIMEWLEEKELLTETGKEIKEIGIDQDFSLTSEMVNKKGNELLEKSYKEWIKELSYDSNPSLKLLEEQFSKLS